MRSRPRSALLSGPPARARSVPRPARGCRPRRAQSCALSGSPSAGSSSARTSKPSRATRVTTACAVVSAGSASTCTSCGRTSRPPKLRDRPDERHHERRRRLVVDLGGARRLLDPALVDDHDLLGDLHRLLLVVRHEDRRHVHLVVQAPQPGAQLLAHPRVERAERLVEQQHRRLDGERAGERHPLALAAGELARVALAQVRRGRRGRAARPRAAASRTSARLRTVRPNATLSAHGHVLERRVVLEDEADLALAGGHAA